MCGIYQIVGPNGRRYIGQSINIRCRWHFHKKSLRRGTHTNGKLQNAWIKYGESAFLFRRLLSCCPVHLDYFEQLIIDGYDAVRSGYNIHPLASSNRGCKNPRVAEANRLRKGDAHASFGIPRPDLVERNRRFNAQKGLRLADNDPRVIRSRKKGPDHFNYGRKITKPRSPDRLGPQKLRPHLKEIDRRLKTGEGVMSLSRSFNVKWETMKRAIQRIKTENQTT